MHALPISPYPIDAQVYLACMIFSPHYNRDFPIKANGTFTTADAKTVTVVDGIVKSIA